MIGSVMRPRPSCICAGWEWLRYVIWTNQSLKVHCYMESSVSRVYRCNSQQKYST